MQQNRFLRAPVRRGSPTRWIQAVAVMAIAALPTVAQEPVNKANYKLAEKFSTRFLRPFVYDSSVRPNWIGDGEKFWYRFKRSDGVRYWLVDPVAKTKVALFDHELLAAELSQACETAMDFDALELGRVEFDDAGEVMTFTVEKIEFKFERKTGTLTKVEKPAKTGRSSSGPSLRVGRRGGFSFGGSGNRGKATNSKKDQERRRKQLLDGWRRKVEGYHERVEAEKSRKDGKDEKKREDAGDSRTRGRRSSSAWSPDLGYYVFSKQHDIFVAKRDGDVQVIAKETPDDKEVKDSGVVKAASKGKTEKAAVEAVAGKAAGKASKKPAPIAFPFEENKAVRLSDDGEEDYSYGGVSEFDYTVPKNVNWREDSAQFYLTRSDSRGVEELFLVDSLGEPRPTLRKYKYPMPGEDKIRHSELMVWDRDVARLIRVVPRWKDESYLDVRWLKNGELRVLRRDRLRRNVEYGVVDPKTGAFETLFSEGIKKGTFVSQSIRYLEERDEFVWWSERSGWGHYYLYGLDGKLKNPITKGRFRASAIIDVDEENGVLWFRANARERGESIYHDHLYRVRLDGGGLKLLDKGDATHRSVLSKSREFIVDNGSRVDLPPKSVLRDCEGEVVMELESADMSQLEAMGWKPPERFTVKAADGLTDLYGNMWKPFDFDPNRKYPIIAHVYPGPQTEGVTHRFSAIGSRQELAQLGFIVIQVGHRGGAPTRSKSYASYGYYNMRDYGLEDKKSAIEQLAARHDFIDVDRVGIYGHSGGGFMTAAALLREPYNRFFKVGVSTAGNHDNNVYNNSWAERYHGLKEVEEKKAAKGRETKAGKAKADKGKADKGKVDKSKAGEVKVDEGTEKVGGAGETKVKQKVAKNAVVNRGRWKTKSKSGDKTDSEQGDSQKGDGDKKQSENDSLEKKAKFEIKIPTNAELAANLEGKLLLIHGEIDNNVHPAGTMRLVDALIKANKRFDMLIIPGARHSFGSRGDYVKHRTWEYFAEHLLGDRQPGASITRKSPRQRY